MNRGCNSNLEWRYTKLGGDG